MAKARRIKQISFSMANRTGLLSEIAAAIANKKVKITALCAYESEDNSYFMLTTDSNAKAKKALAELGIKTKEDEVVAVEMPNKVGELHKVSKTIANAGININYVYGTTGTGKSSVCVFKTFDNKKVSREINK